MQLYNDVRIMSKQQGKPVDLQENLDKEDDYEEIKKDRWYATGSFTIMPNTYVYKTWVLFKSLIYLLDLYQVTYLAALNFKTDEKIFDQWNFFVTSLNIMDIIVSFVTAHIYTELNMKAQKVKETQAFLCFKDIQVKI